MKFALAQLNPIIGNLERNAQDILRAAQAAQAQGAQVLLTPELSLCGYPPRDLLLQLDFVRQMDQMLKQLAQDLPHELWVLVGTVREHGRSHQVGGKPLFNSMALLHQGQLQQVFHKRLLPTYDVFDEHRYFEPGQANGAPRPSNEPLNNISDQISDDQTLDNPRSNSPGDNAFTVADSSENHLRIGVTICEDLWNDEEFWGKRSYRDNPIADLAQQGVDIIVNLSASPYSLGKPTLRETMLQHLAQRHDLPILYVNQVGGNDDLIFDGGSLGVDRQGNIVCRAPSFETALTLVEVDIAAKQLHLGPRAPLSRSPEAELWRALVLGIKDYAHKCGFSQAILGLSGGIDSALVAALAAAALGPANVLGILMPSPYSSDHSITDAEALAKNLGIATETIAIAPAMAAFEQALQPLFAGTTFGLAEENLQSRIRGTLLMAIANKFGHLLLSTGNKSEIAVGYCTLYGDMNGGLGAIADLPKTQVYKLCHWLNTEPAAVVHSLPHCAPEIIPNHIITKPPSAELRPGQTDQDSLPSYDILDEILDRLVCQHQSTAEIMAAGFETETVRRVTALVNRAEFKRRQAPPGLKVTDRAFGTGWRMAIAKQWQT